MAKKKPRARKRPAEAVTAPAAPPEAPRELVLAVVEMVGRATPWDKVEQAIDNHAPDRPAGELVGPVMDAVFEEIVRRADQWDGDRLLAFVRLRAESIATQAQAAGEFSAATSALRLVIQAFEKRAVLLANRRSVAVRSTSSPVPAPEQDGGVGGLGGAAGVLPPVPVTLEDVDEFEDL